jgi:hypothetical protein
MHLRAFHVHATYILYIYICIYANGLLVILKSSISFVPGFL